MKMFVVLFALMLLASPAAAVMTSERCLNDTHLELYYSYNLTTDGTAEEIVYNQTHLCANNCTSNRCEGTDVSADMMQAYMVGGLGIFLLLLGVWLGMPYGKVAGTEQIKPMWDVQIVIRYMFFFLGLYFVYMSMAMVRRVGDVYGAHSDVVDATGVAVLVLSIVLYLFLIVFITDVLFYILKVIGDRKDEKYKGYEGRGGT
ncbi:MAG: hypothetical protein JJE48_06680 [Actinobacteria bacterium]|nr:hypothetical protein [Actinomycetota bacterium]